MKRFCTSIWLYPTESISICENFESQVAQLLGWNSIGVHYLFCNSAMSEGFDPRKSKIGEKALVAFIDAEITEDLQTVRVTYSTNHTGSWNWKGCCRETEELQRSCSTILPCSLYRSTTRTSSSASSSC